MPVPNNPNDLRDVMPAVEPEPLPARTEPTLLEIFTHGMVDNTKTEDVSGKLNE